ncbi:MAG: glycoside hydrolase family 92 protein, partial [Alistipes sp.]|nr:glycoside hydrolase family 92 protein [Alistipes sp.]
FDPYHSNHNADDYCEGNAWQYTWLVPHDVEGLAECFGGKEAMIEKLDSLFTVSSEVSGEHKSADISGLIGQYAHGNEPSHHTIYMYALAGEPWKCADKVREVLQTLYFDGEAGLSGNEDVGQMSAWYVMSAMGLYEVEPAGARYWFGSPILDEAKLKVKGGEFTIIAENNSEQNKYIQSVTLNGKEYRKPWISHDDLIAGGELRFVMGGEKKLWY